MKQVALQVALSRTIAIAKIELFVALVAAKLTKKPNKSAMRVLNAPLEYSNVF